MSTASAPGSTPNARSPNPKSRSIQALCFVLFYFIAFGYPPLKVASILAPSWSPGTGVLLLLWVGPAVGWLSHQRWRNAFTRGVLRVTYTWLGIAFLSLSIILVWDLARCLDVKGAVFSDSLLLMVLSTTLLYAWLNAFRLRLRRVRVNAPGLQAPMRAALLSDVHIGSRSARFLARVVTKTNACRPDVVFITGDLVDLREMPESIYKPLSRLEAPVFFAIGNHERYIGPEEVCKHLRSVGVGVLRNEVAHWKGIQIIGIDDAETPEQVRTVLGDLTIDRQRFTVLLYHRPDGLESAAAKGVHLMLCGHTHNGQIMPFNYLVKRVFPRICGRYEAFGTVLYVSPGTGTWGPLLRFGSANEITALDLIPPKH